MTQARYMREEWPSLANAFEVTRQPGRGCLCANRSPLSFLLLLSVLSVPCWVLGAMWWLQRQGLVPK